MSGGTLSFYNKTRYEVERNLRGTNSADAMFLHASVAISCVCCVQLVAVEEVLKTRRKMEVLMDSPIPNPVNSWMILDKILIPFSIHARLQDS